MMRQQTHLLLDRAAYASTLRGHYGLNLPAYTHWTSPIRRYPDLVNHRQLNAFLKGEALPYTLDQLQELAEHLNEVLEVQRVARETHLKGKADSLARKRADDPRRLDSLDAKGIERVVKVEARSGEDVGDVLRDAVVRRLHEGRLPGICAAALFVEAPRTDGWMALREEIAKWVVDRPENAVTLLHLASQAGWPAPTYHVDQVGGPDHAPVFSGSAVLAAVPSATTPVTWSTQAVLASSRKEARQRAAAALVCALADVDPPVYGDKTPVPAPKPKAPSKQDRDPISLLQEKSQAERLPAPQYAFEMSGPSHAPVVTCVVEFNGRTAMGRASSKQDAKRAAARTLVGQFESV
jgi:ribonuclease R